MAELVGNITATPGVAHLALVSIEGERKFAPDWR
jgi:hypothetical protein